MLASQTKWSDDQAILNWLSWRLKICMRSCIASGSLFGAFHLARTSAVNNHIFVYQAIPTGCISIWNNTPGVSVSNKIWPVRKEKGFTIVVLAEWYVMLRVSTAGIRMERNKHVDLQKIDTQHHDLSMARNCQHAIAETRFFG